MLVSILVELYRFCYCVWVITYDRRFSQSTDWYRGLCHLHVPVPYDGREVVGGKTSNIESTEPRCVTYHRPTGDIV